MAEPREPLHASFAPEASDLALCVAPGRLLNRNTSCIECHFSTKDSAEFAVTDKVKGLGILGHARIEQRANFFQPAARKHSIGARVNALIERFALRREANLEHMPPL